MIESGVFTYGFSRRPDGNMALHVGDTSGSLEARRRFLAGLAIESRQMVVPCQVHGGAVVSVGPGDRGRGAESFASGIPDTDALVTGRKQIALAVQTADCLPILMCAADGAACAAVHAGWKSTRERIAASTVGRLRTEFGAVPASVRCFLGPSIRPCCYQVGEEFADIFPYAVSRRGDKLSLDLVRENCRQLVDAGVREENIFDSGLCTCCNPDYFSFRRDGQAAGRMMAVIMLK